MENKLLFHPGRVILWEKRVEWITPIENGGGGGAGINTRENAAGGTRISLDGIFSANMSNIRIIEANTFYIINCPVNLRMTTQNWAEIIEVG